MEVQAIQEDRNGNDFQSERGKTETQETRASVMKAKDWQLRTGPESTQPGGGRILGMTRRGGSGNRPCSMIYTDGSCFKGMVGAAAALYANGIKQETLGYQLGTRHLHTVFEGELTGIILGLHLVINQPEIHLPSTSASTTRQPSGQYRIDAANLVNTWLMKYTACWGYSSEH